MIYFGKQVWEYFRIYAMIRSAMIEVEEQNSGKTYFYSIDPGGYPQKLQ